MNIITIDTIKVIVEVDSIIRNYRTSAAKLPHVPGAIGRYPILKTVENQLANLFFIFLMI